jgi:hypothetical protein
MGSDEQALIRLWREKRGEIEPEDLSGNLVVQLGLATEDLNRRWYEANTGQVVTDIQEKVRYPALRWMGATLDGPSSPRSSPARAKLTLITSGPRPSSKAWSRRMPRRRSVTASGRSVPNPAPSASTS